MHLTRILLQHRQPMIKFLGKRSAPKKIDHTPHAHPASPTHELPSSFASYRQNAQQHGPLTSSSSSGSQKSMASSKSYGGAIGSSTGASLGDVRPQAGEVFDVSELPARFRRRPIDMDEIEAIDSGGGSLV